MDHHCSLLLTPNIHWDVEIGNLFLREPDHHVKSGILEFCFEYLGIHILLNSLTTAATLSNLGINMKQREALKQEKIYLQNSYYSGTKVLTIAKWNGTLSFFTCSATVVGDTNVILYDNGILSYIQAGSVSRVA